MGLTNAFRDVMAGAMIGVTFTKYDNTNAYLGVGDSSTAFVNTQTDLVAATNKLRKAMDATFPTSPPSPLNVLVFRSTFATTDANFAWQEVAVFNASSGATMMCRVVNSLGTKTSASSWQLTHTVTIAVA